MATAEKFTKSQRLQSIRLRDNLLHLMKQQEASMTDIHRHTGVPITTIQRICKDINANPTLASLIPIAEFFSLTLAQLIGEEPLPDASMQKTIPQYWKNVPIICWQQATKWPEISLSGHQQRYLTTELQVSATVFSLEILEDHHDSFHRGSLLVVDPEITPNHRDYVISVKEGSPLASLKQLLIHENDSYLKPTNPEFKTTLMNESQCIIGVVIQVRMNLK